MIVLLFHHLDDEIFKYIRIWDHVIGHKYAAGGFSSETLDQVVVRFKELVKGGFYA